MARSLLMDCLKRLLSPVLSLDFSSQDRYRPWNSLEYSFIYFFSRNFKILPVKYWNGNRGSQQRESTVCHGPNSRLITSIFEFFHACAVLKRSINPKINGKRDPGGICLPRSLECDFPRKLAGNGRLKDLQCYWICISKHQERHPVVKKQNQ